MGKEVDLKEEDVYTCKFFPREFIENSLQFNNWTVFSITVDAVGAAMSHLLPTLEELTVQVERNKEYCTVLWLFHRCRE